LRSDTFIDGRMGAGVLTVSLEPNACTEGADSRIRPALQQQEPEIFTSFPRGMDLASMRKPWLLSGS
jgi:hypothetical protein